MTALEKGFETVEEKQRELRKLKGTNSESTWQEKVESSTGDAKLTIGANWLFKGIRPYLSFLCGHNRNHARPPRKIRINVVPDDRRKMTWKHEEWLTLERLPACGLRLCRHVHHFCTVCMYLHLLENHISSVNTGAGAYLVSVALTFESDQYWESAVDMSIRSIICVKFIGRNNPGSKENIKEVSRQWWTVNQKFKKKSEVEPTGERG